MQLLCNPGAFSDRISAVFTVAALGTSMRQLACCCLVVYASIYFVRVQLQKVWDTVTLYSTCLLHCF